LHGSSQSLEALQRSSRHLMADLKKYGRR
jgi:hypothetical protein